MAWHGAYKMLPCGSNQAHIPGVNKKRHLTISLVTRATAQAGRVEDVAEFHLKEL